MTFNDKIDKYMKENNYNLKQLAIASDIPYTTLNDFYNKKSADNSRLSTIRKLSKFMGCSMDYLAYDEIEDFNNSPISTDKTKIENINDLSLLEQYHILFDKDSVLTEEQKKFFIDFLTEKHKEIDKKVNME